MKEWKILLIFNGGFFLDENKQTLLCRVSLRNFHLGLDNQSNVVCVVTGQARPLSACYIWINLIVHLTSVCITPSLSPSPRRVATLLKLLGWSWQSDRTARPCHWMSARCCTEKHAAYLDLLKWLGLWQILNLWNIAIDSTFD